MTTNAMTGSGVLCRQRRSILCHQEKATKSKLCVELIHHVPFTEVFCIIGGVRMVYFYNLFLQLFSSEWPKIYLKNAYFGFLLTPFLQAVFWTCGWLAGWIKMVAKPPGAGYTRLNEPPQLVNIGGTVGHLQTPTTTTITLPPPPHPLIFSLISFIARIPVTPTHLDLQKWPL